MRNVIERIFGVLERRFQILIVSPHYNIKLQAQIPAALIALHNFIHLHSQRDKEGGEGDETEGEDVSDCDEGLADNLDAAVDTGDDATKAWCDSITEAMWVNYQWVLQEQSAHDEAMDIDSEDNDDAYSDHD